MSKYTTQLRWPIEQKLKDLSLENLESNWPQTYSILGLNDYPIFDEDYRTTLNNKIIRAYYFREIGFETLGQFSWYMRRTMFEIMPYYNQLYESESLVTDPMKSIHETYTSNWTRDNETDNTNSSTSSNTGNSSSSTTSNGTTTDRNVFEDTPMSMLDDNPSAVENLEYATNVTYDNGTSTDSSSVTANSATNGTANSTSKRTDDSEGTNNHTLDGFRESQSKLLKEYRETFLNIDLEIVDRLSDLFMGLW